MNDIPPAEDASEFPGRQAAVRLGAALLVVLFLVLVLTWRDNGHRAALETTAEFTSVGDAHYFPMPATPPPPPFLAVASLQGKPLYPADYRRHEYAADDMTRVGVDEKGGYIVYEAPQRAKDADERKLGKVYFLKISPKEYLKVRALIAAP
ncbi:MAG: hypothetical protein P4L99_12800 [Chthoniobacter sp.]|nr:hypothetical protein [Chthoniobacter sp.]